MTKSMPTRSPEKALLEQEAQALVQQFLANGGQILTVDHAATGYPYNEPRKVEPNGRVSRVTKATK